MNITKSNNSKTVLLILSAIIILAIIIVGKYYLDVSSNKPHPNIATQVSTITPAIEKNPIQDIKLLSDTRRSAQIIRSVAPSPIEYHSIDINIFNPKVERMVFRNNHIKSLTFKSSGRLKNVDKGFVNNDGSSSHSIEVQNRFSDDGDALQKVADNLFKSDGYRQYSTKIFNNNNFIGSNKSFEDQFQFITGNEKYIAKISFSNNIRADLKGVLLSSFRFIEKNTEVTKLISSNASKTITELKSTTLPNLKEYKNLAFGYSFKIPDTYKHVGTGAAITDAEYNEFDFHGSEFMDKDGLTSKVIKVTGMNEFKAYTMAPNTPYLNIVPTYDPIEISLWRKLSDQRKIQKAFSLNGNDYYSYENTCQQFIISLSNNVVVHVSDAGNIGCETMYNILENLKAL
ncbi:hypothetical protein KAK05_00905 [Candidatus Parcubacteria bacterium]|nr:hypothetical protein [Candidatus Parcubacteria bacterium]